MHTIAAVMKRELKAYFSTPVAYVLLFVFLFFASFLTFRGRYFEVRQADLRIFFDMLPMLFIFLAPAIGMRLWSEERKTGTIELLFSMPVTVKQAVIGKYLAAWIFIGVALLLTFPLVITTNYLGNPDNFVIFTGYLGAFLLSGCYLVISIFCSSITSSQVISFIVSVMVCSIFVFADYPSMLNVLQTFLPAAMVEAVENMSFVVHFESIRRGVLEFRDISFYLLFITGWIAATCLMINERREA
ncbi:MAG: ABC transporter permease [Syntrophales bacterium]|jgi:ABC-2 type transport system permease protein|nr:ABC transporter permease [Syntrophales bacterium]MDY0043246.1 ABC transporter permease subunit [Syntrophales bacterium]